MRVLYAVEVRDVYTGEWKVKAISTSGSEAARAADFVERGQRYRVNQYTYDDLEFIWTYARDCATVEECDEAGTLS